MPTDLTSYPFTMEAFRADVLRHLTFTLGKDADHARTYDWRMALSFALRDRIVGPWFAATKKTWAEDRKRVYYLSMEFLIGRILEDAAINVGLYDIADEVMRGFGQSLAVLADDEPDAALGNGGLGLRHPLRTRPFPPAVRGWTAGRDARRLALEAQSLGVRAPGSRLHHRLQGQCRNEGRQGSLAAGRDGHGDGA